MSLTLPTTLVTLKPQTFGGGASVSQPVGLSQPMAKDAITIRFGNSATSTGKTGVDQIKPQFNQQSMQYLRLMKSMMHYPKAADLWPVNLMRMLTADAEVKAYLQAQKLSADDIFIGLDQHLPKTLGGVSKGDMQWLSDAEFNKLGQGLLEYAKTEGEKLITPVTIWRWLMQKDPSGTMNDILAGAGIESSEQPDKDMVGRIRKAPPLNKKREANALARPTKEELDGLDDAMETLPKKVLGQSRAIEEIIALNKSAKTGYPMEDLDDINPNAPKVKVLLLGPSGVGKTYAIKQLAKALGRDLIIVSMSEYKDKMNAARLGGAAPGYTGYGDKGSFAVKIIEANEAVTQGKKKPPIVLLDEIEKAHTDIFDILMQVLDQGRLESGTGQEALFEGIDIYATSNIAQKEIAAARARNATKAEVDQIIMAEMEEVFRPEFIGRFETNFIIFDTLSKEDTGIILDKNLSALKRNVKQADGFELEIPPAVRDFLLEKGYDTKRGIRTLIGETKRHLGHVLTHTREALIQQEKIGTTAKLVARLVNGSVVIERVEKPVTEAQKT